MFNVCSKVMFTGASSSPSSNCAVSRKGLDHRPSLATTSTCHIKLSENLQFNRLSPFIRCSPVPCHEHPRSEGQGRTEWRAEGRAGGHKLYVQQVLWSMRLQRLRLQSMRLQSMRLQSCYAFIWELNCPQFEILMAWLIVIQSHWRRWTRQ